MEARARTQDEGLKTTSEGGEAGPSKGKVIMKVSARL